jgi:hypothetical protein
MMMVVVMMMIEEDKYGAVVGIRFGRGNGSTKRKLAPVPFCPPRIPHHAIRNRTRTAAVGTRRLTAWAVARPKFTLEEAI